ncbi:hypothetical protein HYH03_015263 [Edaphochlamys debaryana]|uniref:Inositol-pentakisphosphate 2-kinase n=1 Tax=Edaphochlamys debaryana TaxID=47281 RepID=A0A836BRE7_9CHLO|nr:hypothetical protein HYH03_015263 [Edaphochlamys debaryana]|eukprot:KAG2486057.1 hypothetical protein HYH03_015263 [Edaphochlamys debaryana]
MDWELKGQGAANVVFGYAGDDPSLRGHVLRVRKATAHVASPIDQLVWAGVVEANDGCAVSRELSYIQGVMAPLMGSKYVFPGSPIPLPESLLPLLAPAGADHAHGGKDNGAEVHSTAAPPAGEAFPALLMPDHTTLKAGKAPAGFVGVGPTVCFEMKPKWGLTPGQGVGELPPLPPLPPGGAEGAAAEEERAPKAPAPGSPLLRYPRFMLHMLAKHVEKGSPLSYYNPLDLFSGERGRTRAALRALLQAPSNNLVVFVDGAPTFGVNKKQAAAGAQKRKAQEQLVKAACEAAEAAAAADDALAEAAAGGAELAANGLPLPEVATEAVAAPGDESKKGSGSEAEAEASRAALEKLTEVLKPLVAGAAGEGQAAAEVEGPGPAVGPVLEAVVSLVAEALLREGVLSQVVAVQGMDPVGPEGAVALYQRLQRGVQSGELPLPHPGAPTPTPGPAWQPLLGALRSYLQSATAKDCGVMVTMQRAERAPGASEGTEEQAGGDAAQEAEAQAGRPWIGLLRMPGDGSGSGTGAEEGPCWLYKVALVDLDVKAAAKVGRHAELARELEAVALAHTGLLERYAAEAGWEAPPVEVEVAEGVAAAGDE